MNKKRILWSSEFSLMQTGFSKLSREILKRLHKTNKYEIAEYASYLSHDDPRVQVVPWKIYSAIPDDAINPELYAQYQNDIYGQFGRTLFEYTCLEFRPDIVCMVRDHWMDQFVLKTPYRDFFKIIWMPTLDGEPQRLEWLEDYADVDLLLTYSEYGKNVLSKEAPNKVEVFDVVRPCVDPKLFKPLNKKQELRSRFGIPEHINIILMNSRNQRRKLFPDLMEMFSGYLKYCKSVGDHEKYNNTYLYIHSSFPDVGWDFGKLIIDNQIGHKVLFTYVCKNCQKYYPTFFQSELSACKHCGAIASHMPNTNVGVTEEQLCEIYNMADLYVQYTCCEGMSLTVAEAKACGISAMATDYSAVAEQVRTEGCWPLKVHKFFHETVSETEQKRALPDNKDAVKKIYKFFSLSDKEKQRYSRLVRSDVIDHYSFDRAAKIWENAIDSLETSDHAKTWLNPVPKIIQPDQNVPQIFSNSSFIDWCIDNVIYKPHIKASFWKHELVKSLNIGYRSIKLGPSHEKRLPFDREKAYQLFLEMAQSYNSWERKRVEPFQKKPTGVQWELV